MFERIGDQWPDPVAAVELVDGLLGVSGAFDGGVGPAIDNAPGMQGALLKEYVPTCAGFIIAEEQHRFPVRHRDFFEEEHDTIVFRHLKLVEEHAAALLEIGDAEMRVALAATGGVTHSDPLRAESLSGFLGEMTRDKEACVSTRHTGILSWIERRGIGLRGNCRHDAGMWIRFLGCVVVLACGGEASKDVPPLGETGFSDTNVVEEDKVTGCVRGQLRDFRNAAYSDALVRAVELERCTVLDEDSSFGDGSFCIENLPLQATSELQVSFVERCTWPHALEVQPIAQGSCAKPSTCAQLETWFECEGNSISCQ